MAIEGALGMLMGIVALIAVFTFVSVAVWSENRRKERESYYRHETLKKVVEQPGETSQRVLDHFRHEEVRKDLLRRDGMRLGGLITFVVGVGLLILLRALEPDKGLYLVSLLPLLIGGVLALYSFTIRVDPKGKV